MADVYLDHAAATPVSEKVLQLMLPYFVEEFYNPSSPYLPAKHVHEHYEAAKGVIAGVIGAKAADLVMTGGATESINLAFSVMEAIKDEIKASPDGSVYQGVKKPKVLVLATEHVSVLQSAYIYEHELIQVDKFGLIDLRDFRAKLDHDVALVSVSLVNNELGTIQPLAEIAELLRSERARRLAAGETLPLHFHTDASQALNLMDVNVARLGVDLMTLNAAKCEGPKGIGALYFGHGVKLVPQTLGGGQERGLRSGTENVSSTIGFAAAVKEAKDHIVSNRRKYQEMAQILRRELAHNSIVAQNDEKVKDNRNNSAKNPSVSENPPIPAPVFLGHPKHQLVNFVPVCFPGIDAERLVYRLEMQGILTSTGAACAANKGTRSHVLAAIGLSDAEIAGSLRLSLGSTNTKEEILEAAKIIRGEVEREYRRVEKNG